MKRILKIVLPVVLVSLISALGIVFIKDVDYYVNSDNFNTTVAYRDEVDLSGLQVVKTESDEIVEVINVDESMVTKCDSTSSIGEKTLTISYEKEEFIINFIVKYKVEFYCDDQVVSTQYVDKASEIVAPTEPTKTGYEFRGWNPEIPSVINNNVRIDATFSDVPSTVPNLGKLSATYGDTLASFTLPKNAEGKWEFVDDLTTTVGNVGENQFMVQFVPTNTELTVIKDYVTIVVAKKKLGFNNIVKEFTYDGESHIPTYELEVDGLNVVYNGQKGTDIGSYFYSFEIVDDNYEGGCYGYFSVIENTNVVVDIESYEITLGDELPTFEYTVTGADKDLLQISFVKLEVKHAGEYEIDVIIGNTQFKNVVVNKGVLTVNKASLGVGLPSLTTEAIYGNELSTVLFEDENPNGYWEWKTPELVFDKTGKTVVKLVFTPYSLLDYEVTEHDVTLNVVKRTLNIVIESATYTYDSLEHSIIYKVYDGENEITGLEVTGEVTETNAGSYNTTLEIVDDNYCGKLSTSLKINKATPETNFEVSYDVIIGSKLSDIQGMPEGYSWLLSTTVLSTAGDGQKFDVVFTPVDTDNYEIVNGFFTVNVKKKEASITTLPEYKFTYDGTEKVLTDVYPSHTDSDLVYTYMIGDKEYQSLINAGTYTVTITLPETDQYYEATKVVTVVIETSKTTEPTVFNAAYGDVLSSIELPTIENVGKWVWVTPTDLVGDAGEQYHKAKFETEDPNYLEYEIDVKVVVAKKKVIIEVIENEYFYDGTEHTITYKVLDGNTELSLNVTNNKVSTNACNLTTTLVVDEKNYTGSVDTSLVVKKINPEVEWPSYEVDLYTSLFDLIEKLPSGLQFTGSNKVFDKVGNYECEAQFTPVDTVNYNTLTGVIKVNVISLNSSINVKDSYEFTYGDKVNLNAVGSHTESNLEYTYKLNDEVVSEIKNVGTYTVEIKLPATENYNEATATTVVTIVAKQVQVNWHYADNYEYNGNKLELPTADIQDVKGEYQDLVVTELNSQEFVNAGLYQFVAKFNADFLDGSNYVLSNTTSKEIEVAKATIDLSKYSWNYTGQYIYNGSEHKVELSNLHPALTPTYVDNAKTDAGEYTATVSFEYDEANYNVINEVPKCEWKIVASAVVVTWEYADSYVFTGAALQLPKATILEGAIELNVSVEENKEFRNAGTYSFVASIEGNNYSLSNTKLIDIKVEKATLDVNWEYADAYVYNGQLLANPTAKVTDLLGVEVELNTNTTDNAEFKNALTYTFEAKFAADYTDKDNYVLNNNVSVEVKVEKADYDLTGMEWDYEQAYVYNGEQHTVKVINIIDGLTASYENAEFTNVGNYTASVKFTYDTVNYNEPVMEDLDWSIIPLEVTVSWDYESSYTYTGSNLKAPTATYVNVNSEELELAVVESTGKTFKDVASYTFVATIVNPEVANNYKLLENEITVAIDAATVEIEDLAATYGDTLEDVTLPSSENGTWEFISPLTTSVGNAGNNIFEVKFNSNNDNYETYTTEVVIVVAPKTVIIKVLKDTYTYNGQDQTLSVVVLDGDTELDIEVLGNVVANNVSETNTNLSIKENNYVAEVVAATLTIEQAESVITNSLTTNNSDYTGEEIDLTSYFSLNHNEAELEYSVNTNAVTSIKDAGVYTIIVSVEETQNYTAAEVQVTYTINKISPELTYTSPTEGYTYDSTVISVSKYIKHNNSDKSLNITYKYEMLNTETGEYEIVSVIRDAGTYKVLVTIDETTNFLSDEIEFPVVVEKGHLDLEDLDSIKAIYGQQLSEFDFAPAANGSWAWATPNAYVGNVGTNSHKAIFTPSDDSMESEERDVTFIVSPKTITITLGQTEFDYDGESHTVTYELSETPEGVTVTNTGTITATDYKEGGYEFEFTITGNDNYTGSVEGVLVINQVSSGVTAPTFTATYGQTYEDIKNQLPVVENGTWTFKQDLSTSVGNAVSKSIVVVFTPNSTNYKTEEFKTTLVVEKANYTPIAIPTTYDATYGDLLSTLVLPTSDTNGTWKWETNGTVGNAGTQTHIAIFTHTDVNYNPYQATVTVEVAKADAVITYNIPALTYTGNELIEKYFKLNHSEAELVFTVTGTDTTVCKAGTYKVVVTVAETNNYNASTVTIEELKVAKAIPTTDFTDVKSAKYGQKLSDITLPSGYSWVNAETTLIIVANGQTFDAKFTPEDTDNYEIVYEQFTVNVAKADGVIEVADNQTFTYGDAIDLNASTNNTDGKEITYDITGLDGETELVDASTYTVILSVEESDHYTAASKTITVVINQKEEQIDVVRTYQYGATISSVKHTTVTDKGTITYSETNPNSPSVVSEEEVLLGVAGSTKTIYMIFQPHAQYAKNYAAYVKEITISIVKKQLEFTNVESTFTYDGNPHTVTYILSGLVGTDTVTVNGNVEITNVKDSRKDVTLTVVSDNYEGSLKVDLTITKATPETNFDKVYEANWNTQLNEIQLDNGYKFNSNQTLTTIGVQSFAGTFTPSDTDNYEIVSGMIIVDVLKLETTISVNDLSGLTYIPNQTYTITATANNANEAAPVVKVNGSTEYTIGDAGKYSVVVTVEESAHYQSATLEYEIEIAKATPTTDFTGVKTATYGQTLGNITLPSGYSWVNAETQLTTVANGQTFAAKYTPTDTKNYRVVEGSFTVNVAKAEASVTADASYTFTYSGTTFTLNNIAPSHTETSVVLYVEEEVVTGFTNAGTYNVRIVLPENDHYLLAETTTTVVVNKATESLPSGLTATYGQTLADVTLPVSENGTWAFVLPTTTSVGNAGNQTFQVKFTSTNSNYSDITDNVTIAVAKATTTVETSIPNNLVYNGTAFTYTDWFVANHDETNINITFTLNGETVTEVKNAGTYSISVSMVELDNYTAFNGTYSVTVQQASYTVTSIPTASVVIYGDVLSESTLTGGDSTGSWTWVSATDLVGIAGTRTHKALFTPTDKNYAPSTHDISVTVNKKEVSFTNVKNEFGYNGQTQYITYVLSGSITGDSITVTGNDGLLEVGSGTFTLAVNDNNYYCSEELVVTLTIKPANVTLTLPTHTGKYEDVVVDENLVAGATATITGTNTNVPGTFTYDKSTVVYPTGSENTTETIKVKVSFTPDDAKNIALGGGQMEVTLNATAYVESTDSEGKVNTVQYGTIEKAVAAAGTGDVIWVHAGIDAIIRTGFTLNNELIIPYETGKRSDPQGKLMLGDYDHIDEATLITTVTVKENVVINISVGTTLEIGGELSGGQANAGCYVGHTGGKYASMILEDGAKIISSGTINLFGYIEESSLNNGSQVELLSGVLNMPFVVRDFRGGTYTSMVVAVKDQSIINSIARNTFPFCEFELRNVQSLLTIRYNASITGMLNVTANDKVNSSTIYFAGNTSSYFLQMKDENYSYIDYKYNKETEVQDVDIYGDAQTNGVTISLAGSEMDSSGYYFPFSWRFDISANVVPGQTTAEFSFGQRFELLPGSKMHIGSGVVATANTIVVYDEYQCRLTYGGLPYGYGLTYSAATFIVDGLLTVNNIAGHVQTNSDGAKLEVKNSSSITRYRPYGADSIPSWDTLNYTLKMNVHVNGAVNSSTTACPIGTYYSKDCGWYSPNTSITYVYNDGITFNSTVPFNNYPNGFNESLLEKPSRSHYTFDAWYYDSAFSSDKRIDEGDIIYGNATLYAKWNPVEYSIIYVDKFYKNTDSGTSTTNSDNIFTIETVKQFGEPENGKLVFNGFYIDETLDTKLNNINGAELVKKLSDEGVVDANNRRYVTIYIYWYPEDSGTYKINYVNEKNGVTTDFAASQSPEVYLISIIEESDWNKTKLYDLSSVNGDDQYPYKFEGWYDSNNNKVESITSTMFTKNECTLTAKWTAKNKINITTSVYDNGALSSTTTKFIYYIPNAQVTIPTSYLLTGYAYKATVNGSTDVTLGTAFATTGFASEVNLNIDLHNIITVNCTLEGTISEVNSYSFTVTKYVDSNGKIIESNKVLTDSTGAILTVYGASATVYAKGNKSSSYLGCQIYIYENGVEKKSIYSSKVTMGTGSYDTTITGDTKLTVYG